MVIDLKKIRENTKAIVDLAGHYGVDITGVTKASCGDPEVAKAMVDGGASSLADSRLENIIKMKQAGISTQFILLRTPMLSGCEDVAANVEISFNTEIAVIRRLSEAASNQNRRHGILLMVEMGDRREGIPQDELIKTINDVKKLPGIELLGIGMNLACLCGVVPTREKMKEFEGILERVQKEADCPCKVVSGGNSANIPLLLEGGYVGRFTNLRVGEAILLGLETVNRTPVPDTHQDAFMLEAELIEVKDKPSIPDGTITQNAYGETPEFEDKGVITRAIAAVGRQDVIVEDLVPMDKDLEIIGSSSDHILIHIKDGTHNVGDVVRFIPKYGALVHLYTSGYVGKEYV